MRSRGPTTRFPTPSSTSSTPRPSSPTSAPTATRSANAKKSSPPPSPTSNSGPASRSTSRPRKPSSTPGSTAPSGATRPSAPSASSSLPTTTPRESAAPSATPPATSSRSSSPTARSGSRRRTTSYYTLAVDRLIEGEAGEKGADATLADPAAHPLEKLAAVLGDLERWHQEAAAPKPPRSPPRASRRPLRQPRRRTGSNEIRATLEKALDALGDGHPWWSRGMHSLAEWVRGLDEPQALVKAREIALRGAAETPRQHRRQALPPPRRGDRAAQLLAGGDVERRARQALHPGHPQEPAEALVRAYAYDLDARLKSARDYNLCRRGRRSRHW